MELRSLEYFVAVAEERSFTRAAERCHVAQPAISQQIRTLERELGEPLFERDSRQVGLTSGGLALLPYARACLSATCAAQAEFAARAGLLRGQLTLGMVDGLEETSVPRLLGLYHHRYPGVSVSLTGGSSAQLLEMVIHHHRVDAAVIAAPMHELPECLGCRTLLRGRLVAVVSCSSPLADATSLTIESVASHPIITYCEESGLYGHIRSAFATAYRTLRVTYATNDVGLQVALARESIGVTLAAASDPAVRADPRVAIIPLDPPIFYEKVLLWRQEEPASAPLRAFLDVWTEVIDGAASEAAGTELVCQFQATPPSSPLPGSA